MTVDELAEAATLEVDPAPKCRNLDLSRVPLVQLPQIFEVNQLLAHSESLVEKNTSRGGE